LSAPADALGALAGRVASTLLRLDPRAGAEIAALRGKTIAIESTPPGLRYLLVVEGDDVAIRADTGVPADLAVRGSPLAFARALASRGDPAAWSGAGLEFEGDAKLAGRLRRMLARYDPDLEEPVSWVVGDVAAHHLGNAARSIRAYVRETADVLARDVAEYLEEERQVLAPRVRVEAFLRDVDTLRADANRLEARIDRLHATQ